MTCKRCQGRGVVMAPGRKLRAEKCPDCGGVKKPRNKYNAERTQIGKIKFASKREANRYGELLLLQDSGEISGLTTQPVYLLTNENITVKYPNGRVARYTADFEYVEGGETITEDVKSKATMTEAAKLRLAVFEAIYQRPVRITE